MAGSEQGHGRGASLAGNVTDNQPQALWSEIQKVEVVPAYLSRLQAGTFIGDGFQLRPNLRKQARLHLLGDFQLLGYAAFGFEFLSVRLPAQFQASPHLIEPFQSKQIPVGIFKACEGSTPRRVLRRRQEMNPALAPFFVLGVDIFGHKKNPAVAANKLVFGLVGLGCNQRKIRAAVGRRHFNVAFKAFPRREATVCDQFEAQLLHVESQAQVQVADEDHDVLDAQIGIFPTRAKHATVRPREGGVTGHRRDYNGQLRSPRLTC